MSKRVKKTGSDAAKISPLHPRNRHRGGYDFTQLTRAHSVLRSFVHENKYGNESINFHDPDAVKALNTALLKHHYGLTYWDIPADYLCPPIPGRADYIHHVADLLKSENVISSAKERHLVRCLDIGVGANCVYPIIGNREYGWSFVGSDIDKKAIENARKIIDKNEMLKGAIELRWQSNSKHLFEKIILSEEKFTLSICNPPFHASAAAARRGSARKVKNLTGKRVKSGKPTLNFGGQSNELWCAGGELAFVRAMIVESKNFAAQCGWFTSLISKKGNLQPLYQTLKSIRAATVKTIPMAQGNKTSRILAWQF